MLDAVVWGGNFLPMFSSCQVKAAGHDDEDPSPSESSDFDVHVVDSPP